MSGLGEFLLARIAEAEAGARARREWLIEAVRVDGKEYAARFDTDEGIAFTEAECEAKRRIVALHSEEQRVCRVCHWDRDCDQPVYTHDDAPEWLFPCSTILALSLPYADHPDYREEWKP